MSESSTEKTQEPTQPEATEPKGEATEQKTVPVEAVAKERAEKREAKAQVEQLQEQIKQLREQTPGVDMDALVKSLGEVAAAQVESAVASRLKPLEEEQARYKTAVELGLNEEQVQAVADIQKQYSGMPNDRALALAKLEKPDLFPVEQAEPPAWNPALHGSTPTTGESPMRSNAPQEDFMGKMNEAQSTQERTHWATQEFKRRIDALRSKAPSR